MDETKIARINALYHKSKAEGLTPDEKEEQAKLRKEYIEAIKGNMRATLDNTSIQNEDGTLTPLKIVREKNIAAKNPTNVMLRGFNNNIESIEAIKEKKTVELKKKYRKEISEKRNALSEREVKQRSGIICYNVISSDEYKNADVVCVYQAFRNEVICDDIVEKAYEDNKEIYVPVCNEEDKTMRFVKVTSDTKWEQNGYGIEEPVISANSIFLDKGNDNRNILVVMPGLVFTKDKARIGYGGGYYDKYLENAGANIKTMAICYSFQIINESFAMSDTDIAPMHIVTENGID
ncbi:MAG: 5-formyltetrahydrofolate cyclo-ligase [Lachnospiraceae bacterium]|nr:5-formyltetrahydrofolate cyclo-ligase [Lachnospiraceae bacterium]